LAWHLSDAYTVEYRDEGFAWRATVASQGNLTVLGKSETRDGAKELCQKHAYPVPLDGPRDGVTFDPYQDTDRLNKQMHRVFMVMRKEEWRTLGEISALTGDPEASVSARLRDFRKPKFGELTLNRKRVGPGLFAYQLVQE
jgi:hypothetical protein